MNSMLIIVAVLNFLFTKIYAQNSQNSTIIFETNSTKSISVRIRNSECDKCKAINYGQFNNFYINTISLDTFYPNYYFYFKSLATDEFICESISQKEVSLNENSVIKVQIDYYNFKFNCYLTIVDNGKPNKYQPLIVVSSILSFLYLCYFLTKLIFIKCKNRLADGSETDADRIVINQDQEGILRGRQSSRSNRIKSIDVLRGMCLSIMIFVNFGAGGYSVLDHSVWNGLNLADTVFPIFIFLMGVSIPLSFKSIVRQNNFRLSIVIIKIVRRAMLLFFFGLVTSNSSDLKLSELRIMGVLQRFSISYFIMALVELLNIKLNNYEYNFLLNNQKKFVEIFYYWIQWLVSSFLLFIWILITFLLPLDNCQSGYLGPGGLHENGSHFNCTGGAAGYVDRKILGTSHMYQDPTCKFIYKNQIPFDPEGLLGCLTSCVLTYLGVMTGHIILHHDQKQKIVLKFIFYGIIFGLIGLTLSKFSINDGWIPINKNLWSLSFILVMASIGLFSLSVLFILVDILDWYSGTPFLYMGRNSIVIYIGHLVFGNYFPNFNFGYTHFLLLSNSIYWNKYRNF
ncbi:heparan-alpha-glucosaminide N-acetyltransferase [Brachionus plicatilis]|uniref:Heparan-alpha-glucosaminide N-acetyltransferase n=1 Tax=Brachionus plicatilis TaxID=10195 RepID=A0A3M7RQ40_BRAPC|nr:heparan-alpha-glucosaminide N-acetyltransferase [Brachionus plicatilis]